MVVPKVLLFLVVLVSGCSLYTAKKYPVSLVEPPSAFSVESKPYVVDLNWWNAYQDPKLTELSEQLLAGNYDLKSAVARLKQARELVSTARSGFVPSVQASGAVSRSRSEVKSQTTVNSNIVIPPSTTFDNDVSAAGALSYELDIWGRVYSQASAAQLRADSQFELLRQTKLFQLGTLVEFYFEALRQKLLLNLIRQQIKVSEDFLELTELRFQLGRGNAVDVFQQRASLTNLKTFLPAARRDLKVNLNAIDVLIGAVPGSTSADDLSHELYSPPGITAVPVPAALLDWRPDVKSARYQLEASEYDIAAAVANRLPRLSIDLGANFSADSAADLFSAEIFSAAANLGLPLIDGGRRRAEVRRVEAATEELLNNYSQTYLTALQDVENSIVSFKEQGEIVSLVGEENGYSKQSLDEARSRYVNGLSDYLAVLLELQRHQESQRRLINEKVNFNITRSRLYRALGGVNVMEAK